MSFDGLEHFDVIEDDESGMDGCPKCGGELEFGYGLAGGGCGSYEYCTVEGCDYFNKTQDPDE